jgi:hypothetical protein
MQMNSRSWSVHAGVHVTGEVCGNDQWRSEQGWAWPEPGDRSLQVGVDNVHGGYGWSSYAACLEVRSGGAKGAALCPNVLASSLAGGQGLTVREGER